VKQVRADTLKEDIFYAIVKIHRGKKGELDTRPSDAIALAVLTDSPIFVVEDVLERAGVDIQMAARALPECGGVASILREIEGIQKHRQARLR
jgi:bifunctional DNase/RNase